MFFTNLEDDRTATYSEVEISTDEANYGTEGIALMVANSFGLSLTYYSKYVVGEHLLRTGKVPKPAGEEALRAIVRRDAVRSDVTETLIPPSYLKSLDQLIAGVRDKLEANGDHTISDMDSVDKLERRIDQTVSKYAERNTTMIRMALALFMIGVVVFIVSAYIGLMGNVPTALPVAGMTVGLLLNVFVYFPFRVITRTRDQEIELSTRASLLRFELEHGFPDKESRDKLIQRAWGGPNAILSDQTEPTVLGSG